MAGVGCDEGGGAQTSIDMIEKRLEADQYGWKEDIRRMEERLRSLQSGSHAASAKCPPLLSASPQIFLLALACVALDALIGMRASLCPFRAVRRSQWPSVQLSVDVL
jgi:hypothetical protein